MIDLIYLSITVIFFVIALAYTSGCENLRGGQGND